MAPSGLPIFRPPAKALPPGAEWQATQSPARARYSPEFFAGAASSARAVTAPSERNSAQRIVLETVVTSSRLPEQALPRRSLIDRMRIWSAAGMGRTVGG